MLPGAGSQPRSGRFSRGKLSVLCVEGTLLEGRDSVVLRARDGGWGECLQGDVQTHFVGEPVVFAKPTSKHGHQRTTWLARSHVRT